MNDKSKYLRIRSKFKYCIFLCIYFILKPISMLLFYRKKLWVICERASDAQDNGYFFYKYLCANKKNINCIFLIKKNSPDYGKIKSLGKTISFGSFYHFFVIIGCKVKISSQLYGYAPWVCLATYYRRNKTRDIHVFLQHGITKNFHESLTKKTCNSLSLFICGAKPEHDYILSDFGYDKTEAVYTGFSRFDNLINIYSENYFLFMPTWRADFVGYSDDDFIKTDFYFNWTKLLNNAFLREYCLKNNVKIKFYLHFLLQKFTHLFVPNEYIEIINIGEQSIQNLLMRCNCLVTDFSSVYFDAAYMKKPIVYFQFDEETFNSRHYEKGYFDYRKHGFGDVCNTIDETIISIKKIISNNFHMNNYFSERTKEFFILMDNKNCERIYEKIFELV